MNWETIVIGVVLLMAVIWAVRDFIGTATSKKTSCGHGSCSCGKSVLYKSLKKPSEIDSDKVEA